MNPTNCDIMWVPKYESRGTASTVLGMTPEVSPMLDNDTPNDNSIPYGYCQCGCGKKTRVSHQTNRIDGYVKGVPRKYLKGHVHMRNRRHSHQPYWNEEDGCYHVPLTQGLFAKVDASDVEIVQGLYWQAEWKASSRRWYAVSKVNGIMHRVIMGASPGEIVDHVNHDGLDNRRSNLRLCNKSQNACNLSGPPNTNTSGYLGVSRSGKSTWRAVVTSDGKQYRAGTYRDKREAAIARDKLAIELHGEFAALNFPELACQIKERDDEQ